MKNFKLLFFYIVSVLAISSLSCQNGKSPSSSAKEKSQVLQDKHFEFTSPYNNSSIKCDEPLTISIKMTDSSVKMDSAHIFIESRLNKTLRENEFSYTWKQTNLKTGTRRISADVFYSNGNRESSALNINILSNIKPKEYSYKILKVYPHDTKAYTQGLVYENGFMYESDGEYGQSSLRKLKFPSFEIVKSVSMDDKVFAEGLALVGNELYQISWREKTCFVYDKQNLNLLRKYDYDIAEGWGLTWDGKRLLMTDGSNNVYFIDKKDFHQIGNVEVMDDKGPVDSLNELEYVKGHLFSNEYRRDVVAIIDPETGRVTGIINFKGLLNDADKGPETDVLNGISWNPSNNHFFITGKNWPKLFEIEIENFK